MVYLIKYPGLNTPEFLEATRQMLTAVHEISFPEDHYEATREEARSFLGGLVEKVEETQ
jgi:hypothetical protein